MGRKRGKHKRMFPVRYSAEYIKTHRFDHVKAMEYNSQRTKVTRGPSENSDHVPSRFNSFVQDVPKTRTLLSKTTDKDGNKVFVIRVPILEAKKSELKHKIAGQLELYDYMYSNRQGHNIVKFSTILVEMSEKRRVQIFFAGQEFIVVSEFGGGEVPTRFISKTYPCLADALGAFRTKTIIWRTMYELK